MNAMGRNLEHKTKVLEYLGKNKLMTVATCGRHGIWSATVFYAFNEECSLVFFSKEDTRHAENIADDSSVAVTINQHWGRPGYPQGVQIQGSASRLSDVEKDKLVWRLKSLYNHRYLWARLYPDHRYFHIVPTQVWYIDKAYFGHHNRVQIM